MRCACGNLIPDSRFDMCPICERATLRADIDTAHLKREMSKQAHPSNTGLYTSKVSHPDPLVRRQGWREAMEAQNPLLVDIAQAKIDEIDQELGDM